MTAMSGNYALLLVREERAGAAHAAHDLVEYQQHAVAIADLAGCAGNSPATAGTAPRVAPGYRLGDEGDHAAGAGLEDGLLQLVRHAHAVLLLGLAFLAIAVGVARRDVPGAHQQRPELRAAPRVAADGERAQRVAVIALPPADEMRAVRLADLEEVLARELERRLHAFRPAGNEVDALVTRRPRPRSASRRALRPARCVKNEVCA